MYAHASAGLISFQHPTVRGNETTIIADTAPALTSIVGAGGLIQLFLVNPNVTATHESFSVDGVDAGLWFNGTTYLLPVTNSNSPTGYVPWSSVGLGTVTSNNTPRVQRIFSVVQHMTATGITLFQSYSTGIYMVSPLE